MHDNKICIIEAFISGLQETNMSTRIIRPPSKEMFFKWIILAIIRQLFRACGIFLLIESYKAFKFVLIFPNDYLRSVP